MKEFLVYYDDKWTLRLLDSDTQENNYRVSVPIGADTFASSKSGRVWFKDNGESQLEDGMWFSCGFEYEDGCTYNNLQQFLNWGSGNHILWQRNSPTLEKTKTINGIEAFNAIANDIDVQYRFAGGMWKDYTQDLNHDSSKLKAVHFLCDLCEFRYKPKTIVVNGVEYEDEQKAVNVVKDYFKRYVK